MLCFSAKKLISRTKSKEFGVVLALNDIFSSSTTFQLDLRLVFLTIESIEQT